MSYLRRDSAAVGALHQLASQTELRKCLECPICHEVPLAPIYTCTKGHTICGKCRTELNCGICQEDLSRTPRNAAIELIVSNSSFWCKYLEDGCSKIVKGGEYRSHAEVCEYRRIPCYEWEGKKCEGTLIRFKEYLKHVKDDHEIQGFQMDTNVLTMTEYSNDLRTDGPWPGYYFEYYGETFFRHMSIEDGIVYWWFTVLGSKEDATRFNVKITLYMKRDASSSCEWKIPVYSVRTSPEELQTVYRVAIPSKTLQLYCNKRQHPNGDIFNYAFDLKYEIVDT